MPDSFRCSKCGKQLEIIITEDMLIDYPEDSLVITLYKQSKRKKFEEANKYYDDKEKRRINNDVFH